VSFGPSRRCDVLLNGRNCAIAGRHGDDKPSFDCAGNLLVKGCGVDRKEDADGFGGKLEPELYLFATKDALGAVRRAANVVGVDFVSCFEAISQTEADQPWPRRTNARRIAGNVLSKAIY
jgi:hypothetical protein